MKLYDQIMEQAERWHYSSMSFGVKLPELKTELVEKEQVGKEYVNPRDDWRGEDEDYDPEFDNVEWGDKLMARAARSECIRFRAQNGGNLDDESYLIEDTDDQVYIVHKSGQQSTTHDWWYQEYQTEHVTGIAV